MTLPTDANGDLLGHGYWVKVLSRAYSVWHHGIVSRVHQIGERFYVEITHNSKNGGVRVSSLEEFSQGNAIYIHRRPVNPQHSEFILATAQANIDKPYSVFDQNCEHFCHFCYAWKKKSESVEGLMGLGAVIGGVVLLAFIFGE